MNIEALAWPLERLGEGLEVLARRARLGANSGFNEGAPALPASVQHGPAVERARWVSWACARLGVEAEAVDTAVPEIEALLRDGGPALLTLRLASGPHFVLLLGGRGLGPRTVRVMGADLRVRRCPIDSLRSAICAPFELPLIPEIDRLLERAAVEPKRRARVRTLMLAERLAGERIDGCWILHQPQIGRAHV